MKALRIVLALTLGCAAALVGTLPAQAGGWAVTVLDPLPSRIEPGRGYTIGFWVLQHGSHPYEGRLGDVGLTLVDGSGQEVSYPAAPLGEPAHYSATVQVPRAGTWQLFGRQGVFADYQVGTLTVPGGLTVFRPPTPRAPDGDTHWGAIAPPDVAAMARDSGLPPGPETGTGASAPQVLDEPVTPKAAEAASAPSPQAGEGSGVVLPLVVTLAVAGAAGVLWFAARRRGGVLVRRRWVADRAATSRPAARPR